MTASTTRIFGIPNCETMKKARAWLKEHDVEHEFHDFKKAGIDEGTLRGWISVTGWEALLNRRGTTWRKVPDDVKAGIDERVAIELMLDNPSIIKRPVLITGDRIEVGFKPEQYAAIFK